MTTLYEAAYYKPKIVYGSSTFQFNDVDEDGTARVNLLSVGRTESRRVYEHILPGQDGRLILGNDSDGISLSLTVEIAATTLEAFINRRRALLSALAGGTEDKFTFFRRYVNGDNYAAFTNCVLANLSGLDGPQDDKTVDYVESCQGTIDIISCDPVETIMVSGSLISGTEDLVTETSTVNYVGATDFIIQRKFIIQNTDGDIMLVIDGSIPSMQIRGTIEETL